MIQVAIVDDEKIWREEIEKTIKDRFPTSHLTVTVFTSGEELLRDERKFDVVLMDIELQGMDGFSALSEYRRENGQAIFIILTTHVELSREGYKVEAFRYVDKFHMEEMEEAI
ncbi:MAG: response regulator [Eubacterium sp.]|nr:response regulator [Eubacterium sp.]